MAISYLVAWTARLFWRKPKILSLLLFGIQRTTFLLSLQFIYKFNTMKIRKLIFNAKLEQIEKQNQNIFIFHCSANATQWRKLKNFLYNKGSFPSGQYTIKEFRETLLNSNQSIDQKTVGEAKQQSGFKRFTTLQRSQSFTLFQSTSFKKSAKSTQNELKHKGSKSTAFDVASMLKKPKGCLFYFDTRANSLFETQKKKSFCLELVNKMEFSDLNNHLILLYGQMNSIVINHMDFKKAVILDPETTYQQFFLSMNALNIILNSCLHQKIDEFIYVQESRIPASLNPKELH